MEKGIIGGGIRNTTRATEQQYRSRFDILRKEELQDEGNEIGTRTQEASGRMRDQGHLVSASDNGRSEPAIPTCVKQTKSWT